MVEEGLFKSAAISFHDMPWITCGSAYALKLSHTLATSTNGTPPAQFGFSWARSACWSDERSWSVDQGKPSQTPPGPVSLGEAGWFV